MTQKKRKMSDRGRKRGNKKHYTRGNECKEKRGGTRRKKNEESTDGTQKGERTIWPGQTCRAPLFKVLAKFALDYSEYLHLHNKE